MWEKSHYFPSHHSCVINYRWNDDPKAGVFMVFGYRFRTMCCIRQSNETGWAGMATDTCLGIYCESLWLGVEYALDQIWN